MWAQSVFDRYEYPYGDELAPLITKINQYFDQRLEQLRVDDIDTGTGNIYTNWNCAEELDILSHDSKLAAWIHSKILLSAEKILGEVRDSITIRHCWVNMMTRGSYGKVHDHGAPTRGIALFYLNVPPNSADLVLVRQGKSDSDLTDYDVSVLYPLNVQQNQLLIHKVDVLHGITEHRSDERRMLIVVDFY